MTCTPWPWRRRSKHAKAEQLDGCYLIKTDRSGLSGDELWRIYVLLTRAENAFRDVKSPLAERPIFHHTERRTEAHIFLCVLAYHLLIAIEKTLLDHGIHTSWPTVRDTLKSHQICTVVLSTDGGSTLRIRKAATPEPEVENLYRALGIPSQITRPQRRCIAVKKYVVRLSEDERNQLNEMIRKGKSSAQRLTKARILLKADVSEAGEGWSDSRIMEALETSATTVYRTRQQLVEEGFEAVLSRKQRTRPTVPPIFDGEKEAQLIALACSQPPKGRARWTLRLLEDKVVELNIVDRASDSTIWRVFNKHDQASSQETMGDPAGSERRIRSRHGGGAGGLHKATRSGSSAALPGRILQATDQGNAGSGADEARPASAGRLRIRTQWHGQPIHDVRTARRLAACENDRAPHRRRFCSCSGFIRHPLLPRRQADCAGSGQSQYPHKKASLYETFPAAEARRLVERFEWHYTPKHGSWLDLAESELGVLSSRCLDRRIPDQQTLMDEVAAREHDRNRHHTKADWQFTTENARIKLKHLYPLL